jgi:hypothetical protein
VYDSLSVESVSRDAADTLCLDDDEVGPLPLDDDEAGPLSLDDGNESSRARLGDLAKKSVIFLDAIAHV